VAYRVLLVDDHKIIREGIKAVIERSPEFQVIGEAETGREAVQTCGKMQPDIVVMDVELDGLTGIETTELLIKQSPRIKIIILSVHEDEQTVVNAMRAGARAFVLKKASSADLLDALRVVARGGSYVGSQVSDRLLSRIQRGDLNTKAHSQLEGLTPREIQVLRLIAQGKTSKEMAGMLELAVETVRSYRKNLMRKLGAKNVAALIKIAVSSGLTGWTHNREGE